MSSTYISGIKPKSHVVFFLLFLLPNLKKMDQKRKEGRYQRLYEQISSLIKASSNNPLSNMATICAVLHHKMDYFFWTGFYLLQDGKLQVASYQGPLACIDLEKDTGVCWAGINKKKTILVPDVEAFPGHIACDSKSRSEIVVPVVYKDTVKGVLDVDSASLASFDQTDAVWLEKIVQLVYPDQH